MKKFLTIMMVLFSIIVISACGKEEEKPGNINKADGKYFAIQEVEDMAKIEDYRYWTVVTIKNKKITDVEWNAYHTQGGLAKCEGADKYTCSVAKKYGMENDPNNSAGAWHTQADKATKWIIDNQQYSGLDFTGGVADDISSVTMTTEELFVLVGKALASDPVESGDFGDDGYYYAEVEGDSKTETYAKANEEGIPVDTEGNALTEAYTKAELDLMEVTFTNLTFGSFIVVNGTLVHADFNAAYGLYDFAMNKNKAFIKTDATDIETQYKLVLHKDGEPVNTYKTKDGAKYNYGMRGASFDNPDKEWFKQAEAAETKLLTDQTLEITVTDGNGVIDGLTSVTMAHTVADFKTIIDEVLDLAN